MGVSLAAGGWKAVREARNNRAYQRERNAEAAKNKANVNAAYAQQYYANPLDRADNAALLNHQRQLLNEQTKRATATAAITGATPEAIQAQKNAAADNVAKTVSNIAADNAERKDKVFENWQSAKQDIRTEMNKNRDEDYALRDKNIQNFGKLGKQLGQTAANAFAGDTEYLNEKQGTVTPGAGAGAGLKAAGETSNAVTNNAAMNGGNVTPNFRLQGMVPMWNNYRGRTK